VASGIEIMDLTKKQIIINTPDPVHYSYGICCLNFDIETVKKFFMEVKNELDRQVAKILNKNVTDYFGLFRQGYNEKDGWCYCESLGKHPTYMSDWEKDCFFEAATELAKKYNVEVTIE
jgi:hypothetical protein